MRAIQFSEHGGVDLLRVVDVPDPQCGRDDVIVEVGAVSLNGFDPMILNGSTGLKTPLPMTPGRRHRRTLHESPWDGVLHRFDVARRTEEMKRRR
ncbi:MAG: zinc-binding alcohol dehydrogenase family protein [Ilumatobacteraceae bacterium]|nr:zinc-binding alcohol dehydrogenase family protein [Ilumatobacteraceae bacterium]